MNILYENDKYGGAYCRIKAPEKKSRFEIPVEDIADIDAFCCSYRKQPFFMDAATGTAVNEIPKETQWLGVRHKNGEYTVYFSMVYDLFRTAFQGKNNWLTITAITGDSNTCGDDICAYYKITGHNFYELVKAAAKSVSEKMCISLREDKEEPRFVKDFGWCTWDSFYEKVTGDDVIRGLEKFREGGFVPKLLILDDGWQTTSEQEKGRGEWKLWDFCANEKFEGGLSNTIHKVKEQFDIREFFVWHAVMGYWGGVAPESPNMQKYKPRLSAAEHPQEIKEVNPKRWEGERFPFGIVDNDKFYDFYNDYHTYLKSEGVDGVKIDVQASIEGHGENKGGRNAMVRAMRSGLNKSVMENFNGNIINCMSCSNNIIYNTGSTNLMRSSDDFFPTVDSSHSKHVYTNAINSIWMRMFTICDWDMFQTSHKFAWYHAAARAISGGPVYVSDRVGEHDFELIKALTKDNREIIKTEVTAVPTVDCLFVNPETCSTTYKIFSKNKHNGVVGVFAFGEGGEAQVKADDIEGMSSEQYAVYSFKTGKACCLNRAEKLTVHLGEREFDLVTFAPIHDDFAVIGIKDKLNCGGTVESASRKESGFEIKVNTGGQLMVYCKGEIKTVLVNGKDAGFNRDNDFIVIEVEENGGDVLINN